MGDRGGEFARSRFRAMGCGRFLGLKEEGWKLWVAGEGGGSCSALAALCSIMMPWLELG